MVADAANQSPKQVNYPYGFIEEWWGEPLTAELSKRISRAPMKHLRAFANDFKETSDELRKAPTLPDGILRPVLRSYRNAESLSFERTLSIALNILLYSQQIIIDSPLSSVAELIPEEIEQLLTLKPLADAGGLYLGYVSSKSQHPSIRRPYNYNEGIDLFRARFPELSAELMAKPTRFSSSRNDGLLGDIFTDVVSVISFATSMEGRANAMACNDLEYKMMTSLLHEAKVDRKFWTLATLTQMSVPQLHGKINELVTIRQSDETFNLWREALSTALVQVQRIPNDHDKWQEDANAVLFSELEPLRLKLQRATSKSPALTAMHIGASKISIAGAGALTGWATGGTLASALASSTATTGLESAISYFRAAKTRRQSKAVLDVVLAFQPSSLSDVYTG